MSDWSSHAGDDPRRVLYIAAQTGTDAAQGENIFTLPFEALNADALAKLAPDLVVFPLLCGAWDAIMVLTRLVSLGYRGACLVLTPPLPKPQMIEAELRSYSGEIRVDLLMAHSDR